MTRPAFRHLLLSALLAGALALLATEAQAEDAICRGAAPAVGATLAGPVLHVIDGERLCVAQGFDPATWVEVQIAEAQLHKTSDAPPARGALMAGAFAQDAVCTVTGLVDGRAIATCQVEGRPLAERLGQPDIATIGQTWR